jgi:hypothetical protein
VDGRVRLVIILASARLRESTAVLKTEEAQKKVRKGQTRNSLRSKGTPGRVDDLLGNQGREIKLWVILIRFRSWIREESLLIKMLSNLSTIFSY